MAETKQESIIIPESEAIQISQKRLDFLGDQIAQAQATLDAYTVTEAEVETIKSTLASVEQEINERTALLSSLQASVTDAKNKLSELQVHVAELGDVQAKISEAKNQLSQVLGHVDSLTATETNLQTDIQDLEEKKEGLIQELDLAQQHHDEVMVDLTNTEDQVKEELKKTSDAVGTIQQLLDGLNEQVSSATAEVADLNDQITAKKNELAAVEAAIEKAQKDAEARLAATEAEKQTGWEQRDGELSRREQILEQKRLELVEVKNGLEQFSGKTININI